MLPRAEFFNFVQQNRLWRSEKDRCYTLDQLCHNLPELVSASTGPRYQPGILVLSLESHLDSERTSSAPARANQFPGDSPVQFT